MFSDCPLLISTFSELHGMWGSYSFCTGTLPTTKTPLKLKLWSIRPIHSFKSLAAIRRDWICRRLPVWQKTSLSRLHHSQITDWVGIPMNNVDLVRCFCLDNVYQTFPGKSSLRTWSVLILIFGTQPSKHYRTGDASHTQCNKFVFTIYTWEDEQTALGKRNSFFCL